MGKVSIGGRDYEIELPFKLDTLDEAADNIDLFNQLNAEARDLKERSEVIPTRLLSRMAGAAIAALSVGIIKADPTVTLDDLRANVSLKDGAALGAALSGALMGSGFKPAGEGEAPAGAPQASKRRSAK